MGDPHKGFGARIGSHESNRFECQSALGDFRIVVGKSIEDTQRVNEIRIVVVKVGQGNGQFVEGVVGAEVAVIDGPPVAALIGAVGEEGNPVFQLLLADALAERFGEIHLHRVVVVHPVTIAAWPCDVDAFIGPACFQSAGDFRDIGGGRVEREVARRGGFQKPDLHRCLPRGWHIVVTESPFLLVWAGDREARCHLGGFGPCIGEGGIVSAVAVHVDELLRAVADAIAICISEWLEARSIAVELFGDRVVVSRFGIVDVIPNFLDRGIGANHDLIARSAHRISIVLRKSDRALRCLGIIIEGLGEGLVNRRRGVDIAVEERPCADHMKAFGQAGLHREWPFVVSFAQRLHARIVVVREVLDGGRVEVRHSEGGEHFLFVCHLGRP